MKHINQMIFITLLSFVFTLQLRANLSDNDTMLYKPGTTHPSLLLNSRTHAPYAPPEDKNSKELKKFIFSVALTPRFKTTVPPVNLYFEHGIAGLASAGISMGGTYDSESALDYHSATIDLGLRGCGYAIPIIAAIAGQDINNYGFQPYVGLAYDYFVTAVTINGSDIDPENFSHVGFLAGTRWYPGKGKFALLGEYNGNGLGSKLRVGISLGR